MRISKKERGIKMIILNYKWGGTSQPQKGGKALVY